MRWIAWSLAAALSVLPAQAGAEPAAARPPAPRKTPLDDEGLTAPERTRPPSRLPSLAPLPERPATPTPQAPAGPRPAPVSRAGLALVIVGGAVALAMGGLLAAGGVRFQNAAGEPTLDDRNQTMASGRTWMTAGGIGLGVGAAALIGGAALLLRPAAEAPRTARLWLAPAVVGSSGGLVAGGSF